MTPDVLVVGTSADPHIDAVLRHIPRELSVVRLDVDDYPRCHQFSISYSGPDLRLVLDLGADEVDITNPGAVWFRRLGALGIADQVPDEYRQFCVGEAEQALEGLLSTIRPHAWVNEYWSARRAANKPYQYDIARRAGLATPDTLITNSPRHAGRWLAETPVAVTKSLHSPVITQEGSGVGRTCTFTHRLTAGDRRELGQVAVTACQFQPCLEKAYEVRVTTVGDRHVAVRVDAPAGGIDDWRTATADCAYRPYDLPEPVSNSLARLLAQLGLQYAASDFIVTPDDEIVFLEANPDGAWLWLEDQIPDLAIAKEFASYLTLLSQGRRFP